MRKHATQILAAANIVNGWFERIRQYAKQLAAMKDEQLQQQQTLTLLTDIAKNANFALNREIDPVTGNMQMGIERMYEAIQGLATMDITPFRE